MGPLLKWVFLVCCLIENSTCAFAGSLNSSGIPTKVFRARFTSNDAGFFSCFLMVVGLLDASEQETSNYNSVEVDFGTSGFYYDPAHGKNWWEYYFFPIQNQCKKFVRKTPSSAELIDCANKAHYDIPRKRCKELIDKYIKIRPEVLKAVSDVIQKELQGRPYIGVQYRGTDKNSHECSFLSVESAVAKATEYLNDPKWKNLPIFVATDEAPFLQLMKAQFGDRVVALSTTRSDNHCPIHTRKDIEGYKKGLDALVDCMILSQAVFLVRTSSNLSCAALLFNPDLESKCLNSSFHAPEREVSHR